MASEPLFIGERIKCLKHSTELLRPNEKACKLCLLIDNHLSLTPPFKAYSVRTGWGFQRGLIYEVWWVIKDGTNSNGAMRGFVFKDKDGELMSRVFDADDFIPTQLITEELKEAFRKEREKGETNDDPKDQD